MNHYQLIIKDGRPRDHGAVHECVTIMAHSCRGKEAAEVLCRGVSDYLVDIGYGCNKSDNNSNKNKSKYEKGEVIQRKEKGRDGKHNILLCVNKEELRDKSFDINKI